MSRQQKYPAQARRYYYSPEISPAELKEQADRRRAALRAAGCATYTIGSKAGSLAIICLCCGLGSSHPTDLEETYCGFCKTFHSGWSEKPEEIKR